MIATEQQILESIRRLPADARERVLRAVRNETEEPASTIAPKEETAWRSDRFRKAQQWIRENRKQYDGQYVLLEGDILLAHGEDPRALYEHARERNIRTPFVTRIKAEDLPFGGW